MGVDNARAPWRWVLVAAALASGRAFVVGCGGHVLFRAVLHHFLPLLRRHMRLLRHKQQQPRPPPSPLLSFASSVQPTAALLEIDKRPPHETDGDEGEDGLQETDGPATPLPATDVNDDDQDDAERTSARGPGSLGWWLWDGSQNRESLRLGAFLASMTGGFRVVEFALQRLRGTDDGWNSFLAGAVAGLSIAIDTRLPRQQAVALYVFFKACGMVWSSLTTRGLRPRGAAASGGRWTVAQHGIWCLLCGVIMYCFFCEGELLDSFVYRFLYNCTSTVDQYAMSYVRKYALGMADEDPEAKAQERRDYASGKLRALPPPVVVKRREHFALMRSTATGTGTGTARAGERVE